MWKQTVSINGWIGKEDVIHTHTQTHTCSGIILSHEKEWNAAFCNNMDGPWIYYAKWNKSDRDRQIQYDFTHVESKKKKQNKQTLKIK